jgi:hypothetical protein
MTVDEAIKIPSVLIVKDGKKVLAIFREWKYFRYVDCMAEVNKH